MAHNEHEHHGVPPSHWPIVGSFALFFLAVGAVSWLHQNAIGPYVFLLGALILAYMFYGWFHTVIQENLSHETPQTRKAFQWGMFWFIFTEFMFFATFFGALFYARIYSVPWLGGEGVGQLTHILLWPDFQNIWPLFSNPDPSQYPGAHAAIDPWRIPALNTLVLIASDISITWAYWALLNHSKRYVYIGLCLTILLSIAFLFLQVQEFGAAYTVLGLKLSSGIYGTTFFMLTGVHGLHVVLGLAMLIVLLYRMMKGHFDPQHSFAVAAVSWYWHFIDVLWIAVFIFVYWL